MGEGGTWLLGLLQLCTVWHLNMASMFTRVYSWPLGVNYKKNDQPIHERVKASLASYYTIK